MKPVLSLLIEITLQRHPSSDTSVASPLRSLCFQARGSAFLRYNPGIMSDRRAVSRRRETFAATLYRSDRTARLR